MSSNKYAPGSVAKLLGAETAPSGKETKLQALFSKPPVQSSRSKIQTKVQQVSTGFISNKHTTLNSDGVGSLKKKRKHEELSREARLHDGVSRNSHHKINHKKLRQMELAAVSRESSASESHTGQAADAADDKDATRLSSRAVNAKNALMRIEAKTKTRTSRSTSRDDAATVFVGNVALSVTKKALQRLFRSCGTIETLRIRSVPVADLKLPKKASVIKKQFHPSRNSANAYIVFATEDAAMKALRLNGTELEGLHIRVNPVSAKPKHDHQKSVFIGNLPFDIEEESLRQHFTVCGSVTNVRVIRDQKTGAGKGFGYVTFVDASSVTLALSLHGQLLNGRRLRVHRSTELASKKHNTLTSRQDSVPDVSFSWCSFYYTRTKTASSSERVKLDHTARTVSAARRKKKREEQSQVGEKSAKRQTLMRHRKMKEKTKKKLKKRREARRKQSVGQLLIRTDSAHTET